MYIYMCVFVCMCVYVSVCMRVPVCVCMYACMHVCTKNTIHPNSKNVYIKNKYKYIQTWIVNSSI